MEEITTLRTQNQDLQHELQKLKLELDSTKRAKGSSDKKVSEFKKKVKDAEVRGLFIFFFGFCKFSD
jgi:hypothetical protein